ncbi:MAG TPA: hypothetical protein VGP48_12965 [Stellaceae bacterium]|nr:hypothetical protein [Stellaceae bacterium]
MLALAEHDRQEWRIASGASDSRGARMRSGVAISLALHAAAILALVMIGLPGKEMPPLEQLIPINLVRLGDTTTAASAEAVAALPQQKAAESAQTPDDTAAVPVPATPPPPAASRQVPDRSPPPVVDTAKPLPAVAKPSAASRSDASAAAKLQRKPTPADDLATRLEKLAQLKQPPAPLPPSPRQQEGFGASNIDAASADAARGRDASYGVKDFVRAQVERRWNLDRGKVRGEDWSVSIRMVIEPSGRIDSAEVVDNPRFDSDSAYREFALSARNAVLLSSPLVLPPGSIDFAKDITVDFDSRAVSR